MKNLKTLPKISDYSRFLQIASFKFNLTVNECRDKYGLFTYKQWYELFNN